MANRRFTLLLIALGLILFGLFAWQYYSNRGRFNWNDADEKVAYVHSERQPYGLAIFSALLKGYFPQKQFSKIEKDLEKELKIVEDRPANYVFVGEAMGHDSAELKQLIDFVRAGNTAFIATKTLPGRLCTQLYKEGCDDFDWKDYQMAYLGDTVPMQLYPKRNYPSFPFFYAVQNKPSGYQFHFIPSEVFYCESEDSYQSLGYVENEEKINFAVFRYGKGRFLVHSTPIVFTNFHLLRKEGKNYTAAVLNQLTDGPIYYDTHAHITEAEGRRRNYKQGYNNELPKDSPLATLLSHPSLAWAWYLSLGLGLAYVLFRGKRRQRIIPILPKNSNTSMEFIDTIAHLHFKNRNFQGIGIQKMRLFLAYVRERFGLNLVLDIRTNRVLSSPESLLRLSEVAEVPLAKVEAIFTQYAAIVDYAPTDEMLIDFYRAIEEFRLLSK